jgi:hypothetical protein
VFGERQTLKGAIASADAICRFFASVEAELKVVEQLPNGEELRTKTSQWFSLTNIPRCDSRQIHFSTRMNSPLEAFTATLSCTVSRLAP